MIRMGVIILRTRYTCFRGPDGLKDLNTRYYLIHFTVVLRSLGIGRDYG